ncbi:cell division protein FtsL [Elusimicrobium simillimum]|uniref:hypothetical protein n=1 Tax=Elusimicrobium simillimum TaxID=3143438 RepID=UPI003C6FFE9E
MKTFFWLFVTAVFCLILAFQRVEERRIGIEVAKIESAVSLKESRNQYLRFQINALNSPAIINKNAEEKLDMRLTPLKNVVVVK